MKVGKNDKVFVLKFSSSCGCPDKEGGGEFDQPSW
jgi:hypothetical protein